MKTLPIALCSLTFLFSVVASAEQFCSGATYRDATCANNCSPAQCQDVSYDSDGSLFQCCPPTATPTLANVETVAFVTPAPKTTRK